MKTEDFISQDSAATRHPSSTAGRNAPASTLEPVATTETPIWLDIPGFGRHHVLLRFSSKRRRSISARRAGESFLVMVPGRMPYSEAEGLARQLVNRVLRREHRTSAVVGEDLRRRANRLAQRYLDDRVQRPVRPKEVLWVSNQAQRWGSCSPHSARIRLSDRMAGMPYWVIDYVLVHELAHLVETNHTQAFHRLVAAYPLAERARGYLQGWSDGVGGSARNGAGPSPSDPDDADVDDGIDDGVEQRA